LPSRWWNSRIPPRKDGLDLVVGTAADIAGKVDRATLEKLDGPAIIVVPGALNRRPIVVVTGRSDAELDAAIAKLGIVAPIGTVQGLNALAGANGHQIGAGGQSLTFSDLGLEKQELMGHTLRIGFSAALPRDFLAADYGRVAIDLAGGYAAGLGADAQIIIEVNGRSAGSVRLSSANGENFLHKRHFLPLSAFRPGQNRIELRVNAPDGAAVGCDISANAAPRARVWLNATSRVVFPSLARVGRVPDLAMTSSGAFPFAGTDGNMTLVVPTPDRCDTGCGTDGGGASRRGGRPADSIFIRHQSGRRKAWPCSRGCAGACARSGGHAAGSTRPRPGSSGLVCAGRAIACRSLTRLARCLAKACV
jgi:hypothetical protein